MKRHGTGQQFYGNRFAPRRNGSNSGRENVDFTPCTNRTRELRTRLIHLALHLLLNPGNHAVDREVVEETVCGFLIGRTLEPSWLRFRLSQCVPRMYIRVVSDVQRKKCTHDPQYTPGRTALCTTYHPSPVRGIWRRHIGKVSDDSILTCLSADFDDSATWGMGRRWLGAIGVGVD